MRDDDPTTPCPRCGFDQRGHIATWNDTCPLVSRCTECGFDIDWSPYFTRRGAGWFFESGWRHRPFRSWLTTTLAAFWPPLLWKRTSLTETPSKPALCAWLAPVLLLIFGAALWMHVDAARFELAVNGLAVPWLDPSRPTWVSIAIVALTRFVPDLNLARVLVMPILLAMVSVPIAFLAMRSALREARIQPRHFGLIVVTSLALPLWMLAIWAIVSAMPFMNWSGWQSVISPVGWVTRSVAIDDLATLRRLHELRAQRATYLVPGFGVWILFFWTFAAVRYLQIPRDRWLAIAILATILTTVVTLAMVARVPM